MEKTMEFLDRPGLELYNQFILGLLEAQKITVDGKTIVVNEEGVISAKVNYLPKVDTEIGSLIFDGSPTYVIESSETLVYVSNM